MEKRTGAAYIRVSTDMQTELSPDSQLKAIKQYCKQNGIILSNEYIYADDGISGRTAGKRPEFMRMIATAKTKPKPFDVILVWKFSRFARNREDSIVYKSMLRKDCGVDVISISEPVGEDKTSMLIEALLEAMDEYYSLNLSEEVKRGMTEKVSRGGVVSAPPFGYVMGEDRFIPDETAAAIVRMIYAKFLEGCGTRKIAAELNSLGIKTKAGNTFANRTVEYILTNPVYTGKLRWNPKGRSKTSLYTTTDDALIVDGKHEPIIDTETFGKVQALLAENKARYPKHYNQRDTEYFFRGLVRCSACGATLTRSARPNGLQCHNYARGQCKVSHYITADRLRQSVIECINNDIENPDISFMIEKTARPGPMKNDLLHEQLRRERLKLDRVKAAYADGIDTLEEYKANKAAITETIAKLEDKLNASEAGSNAAYDENILREKLKYIAGIASNPEVAPAMFNSELRTVVSRIIYDRRSDSVKILYYTR